MGAAYCSVSEDSIPNCESSTKTAAGRADAKISISVDATSPKADVTHHSSESNPCEGHSTEVLQSSAPAEINRLADVDVAENSQPQADAALQARRHDCCA